MNKSGKMRAILCALMLAFVLFFSFTIFIAYQPEIADALLPKGYIDDVVDKDLEWWSSDEYLGLSDLKNTVDGWKNNSAYDFEYLKSHPIIIAVIDSGVNLEHELFSGKYDANGNFSTGAVDKNGVGAYDVILRDDEGNPILLNAAAARNLKYRPDDITDDESRRHGTHVTGIVAMLIHALDLEKYVKILPIKASYHSGSDDIFDGDDVEVALDFALQHGADVINMSLSSKTKSFANLETSDIYKKAVLVAAAGNDGGKVMRYPASLPNVIGVMNYFNGKEGIVLSDKSNYGSIGNYGYDLCAPGSNIYSANGEITASSEYKSLSGTSMASPIVSFGIALLAMKYKALSGAQGTEIDSVELADMARNAYTHTLDKSENKISGLQMSVGICKIFDINKLVGFSTYDAWIDVSDPTCFNQQLGSIVPVNLKLKVVPAREYDKGKVEWFANGVKIGDGFEIDYLPKSEVGSVDIKAVWEHDCEEFGQTRREATGTVVVSYMTVSAENVKNLSISANVNGKIHSNLSDCRAGVTYILSVDELAYMSDTDAANCMWFVDGKLVHRGETYDFTPEEDGQYEIKIKLRNFESEANYIDVVTPVPDEEFKRELGIFTIAISVVLATAALTTAIVLILKHRRAKR